jgi:hypothetical protein
MAFPTTSLLDAFTRADNPSSLGANWTVGPESGYASLGVLSNQAYAATAWKANYWNTAFNADQEVYVTVPTLPTYRLRLYVRIQNPGASLSSYEADLKSTGTVDLYKRVAGVRTSIGSDSTMFSAGDKIGLEVAGTTVRLHRYTAAAWSMIEEITGQTDVSGSGYIGMEVGNETTVRMDDFSGGSIVAAAGVSGGQRLLTLGVG